MSDITNISDKQFSYFRNIWMTNPNPKHVSLNHMLNMHS